MNLELIKKEAESFFEWPDNKKSHFVTFTSCLLFAQHCVEKSNGWRPIEEAPKDGSRILIHLPNSQRKVQEVYWAIPYEGSTAGWWSTPHGPEGRGYTILPESPTHWQPLPPAPEAA